MVIEEEEEEPGEGASNAAATQIGLGVNIIEAATTHDEPTQCPSKMAYGRCMYRKQAIRIFTMNQPRGVVLFLRS